MFYLENSLKKGGKFHLIWVADCWPARFASISHRKIWSQDTRKLCDELLQVIQNESGRPSHRFSLRLSSQLTRGLVRLYQKKVNSMLAETCSLNARVMKDCNKKYRIQDAAQKTRRNTVPMLEAVPEEEERVEEMLQQSANVVANIDSITLREVDIPDFRPPANCGFGEEDPNQTWEFLDLMLEQMLGASGPHSALDASDPTASTNEPTASTSNHSRLQLDIALESMSDQETILFKKATVQDLLPEELEKDIHIPEIPPLDLPVPIGKKPSTPEPAPPAELCAAAPLEPEIVTLEALEEGELQCKRRRKNTLIIDKETRLSSDFLRARIGNTHLDLRCEEFSEDVADLRVPAELLLTRPAHAGARFPCVAARPVRFLFSRNLGRAAAAHVDQGTMEAKRMRCVPVDPQIVGKENIPPREEKQLIVPNIQMQRPSDPEKVLISMLQKATLAGMPPAASAAQEEPPRKRRRLDRDGSEAAPPNLDRASLEVAPPNLDLASFEAAPPNLDRASSAAAPPTQDRASSEALPPNLDRASSEAAPPTLDRASLEAAPPTLDRASSEAAPPTLDRASSAAAPPNLDRASSKAAPPTLDRASLDDAPPTLDRASSEAAPPTLDRTSSEAAPPTLDRASLEAAPSTLDRASSEAALPTLDRASLEAAPPTLDRASSEAASPTLDRASSEAAPPTLECATSEAAPPTLDRASSEAAPPTLDRASSEAAPPTLDRASLEAAPPTLDRASSEAAPPTLDRASSEAAPPTLDRASSEAAPPTLDRASLEAAPSTLDRASSEAALPTLDRASLEAAPPTLDRASSEAASPTLDRASSEAAPPTLDRASLEAAPPTLDRASLEAAPPTLDRASSGAAPPSLDRASSEAAPPTLDRTGSKAAPPSLGRADEPLVRPDQAIDSNKIRDQWGPEGTLMLIMKLVKAKIKPLNVNALMTLGPQVPGKKRMTAARCFASLLELKQQGFVQLVKDPNTSKLQDIILR